MELKKIKGSENYLCTVVEIKELFPIEGADRIQRTVIYSNSVIVSKDVKVGDKMLYFNSGTKLNEDFCKWNNLLTNKELNKDKKPGYISYKQLRVKAIRLKGIISDGILLPMESLWFAEIKYKYLMVGDEFNFIDDIKICEKYFVPVRNSNPGGKAPKQAVKINRLIDNQFYLHNDTSNLRRNIHQLNLEDIIGIHYKKHGTSVVIGNVLVKKNLKWYEKLAKKIGLNIIDTEYDIIYSSRRVIKNQYLNSNSNSYYKSDIWGDVKEEVKDKIPKGYTLYGEILGYTKDGSAIQKSYDYGCNPGEHKFYVYRITVVNSDGQTIELTDKQIEEFCEKNGLLYKDTFIYYGPVFQYLTNLIRDGIKYDKRDWQDKLLSYLEKTYNEKDCYMCTNKVPEEGIVIRKESLYNFEAYKLKSKRFLLAESESQDKDEINIEDQNE